MPTTNFTVTTPADLDSDIADISTSASATGADSAPNTAYTFGLAGAVTTDQTNTLSLPSGSSLELDGPGALTVAPGQVLDVTTQSGTIGVLTLETAVSGDALTNPQNPVATIVLNDAELVNGAAAAAHSGANQLLSGTVLGQTSSDAVDNFGQIEVSAATSSTAVFLNGGGTVTNEAAGTIGGGLAGVVFGATGTLTNAGTVTGANAGYGTYFEGNGTVVNGPAGATAAVIQGETAGVLVTNAGTVTNDASIQASGVTGAGVVMASGTVGNGLNSASSAVIQGGEYGVEVTTGNALVTNLGTIEATDAGGQPPSGALVVGASLAGGGTVYNGFTASAVVNSAAVTSGADYGVLVQGSAGAVINSGTISGKVAINFNSVAGVVLDNGAITSTDGAAGTAIDFGNGQSKLSLGSGYTITGRVEGGGGSGATTTLDLTNGTGDFSGLAGNSGTVTGGFGFDRIDTIQIDSGAVWSFSGVDAATNLVVGGEADVAAGGSLEITGSATGAGTIGLGANAALVIDAASGFGTGQGTANYAGDVIAQFAAGNSIDLKDVAFATLSQSFSTNRLQLTDGTHTADLNFAPGFTSLANFSFAADSGSGTVVTVACYCPGTRIATPQGEVAVEALAIGDQVVTADGRAEPIRWIGRRSYAGRFVLANPKVQPVRFRAGSLGGGLPRRDLLVSPEHAMLLDGMLIPARCLVNGAGIVAERGWTALEYIHIELAGHEVILAEGAAAETFLDDESRVMFQNAAEYAALYPDAPTAGGFCAPRVEDGYELEAIRRRLASLPAGFARAA